MRRLPRQARLVLIHVLDSAILAAIAGMVVALLFPVLAGGGRPIVDRVAMLGPWGTTCFVVLAMLAFGGLCPTHVAATVRGLRQFPRHFGLIAKAVLASGVSLLIIRLMSLQSNPDDLLLSALWVAAWCSLGLAAAYGVAVLRTGGRGMVAEPPVGNGGTLRADGLAFGQWLNDDQAIQEEEANQFPEHRDVANRILDRLLPRSDGSQGMLPSVAIMGAYGSGKTSICNLVRDRYVRRRRAGEKLPGLLFCRYEAWQYVGGEAAAKGLVEAATKAISAVADVPELWSLPDQYVAAIREGGVTWARAAASVFGSKGTPAMVLSAIGEVLERLNIRLVVFVDDLDRIEQSAPQAQQAVTQALNQLQNVPNVQYIVAVGPTRTRSRKGSVLTYDLLKLTRYQELVPRLEPKWAVSLIRNLRDQALADPSIHCPWAEVHDEEKDPLAWHDWYGLITPSGLVSPLIELLDTPRALKSTLRETRAAWNSGLKGEINWYELLLACALRVAEPALFEWIERDRDLFAHGPGLIERMDRNTQRQQARAAELREKVLACLRRPGANRQEAVLTSLGRLFPALASRIGSALGSNESPHWGQGVGYCPRSGRPYLERFLCGCLAVGEVPDQPTLQFIKQVAKHGLDEPSFQTMYLDSMEKLTGPLNKFVQFAGLLSLDKALRACDVIVAWAATPGHALQWASPHDCYLSMMVDVHHIIGRSDACLPQRIEDTVNVHETREQRIVAWLEAKIDEYGPKAWAVPEALLRLVTPSASDSWSLRADTATALWHRLAEVLRQTFVEREHPMLGAVAEERFAIYGFLHALRVHKDYADFRTVFTRKMVEQADADTTHRLKASLIISLVSSQHPATDGECPADAYTFSVQKKENEKGFDMTLVLPALMRWAGLALPDPVAGRAFDVLKEAYGLQTPGTV